MDMDKRVEPTTVNEFWKIAEYEQMQAEYMVQDKVQFLQTATLEQLKDIFIQYRYFTKYYGSDLGLLIYKVPYGNFKSLISEIAAEELGNGKACNSHIQLWDNFLLSLGVEANALENSINPRNAMLLEELRRLLHEATPAYAIGLRGMGGECLCQIYLTAVYENFRLNPEIEERKHRIDWSFWDIHAGDADIEHRMLVKAAISEIVENEPASVRDLSRGYLRAKGIWDQFWKNAYEAGYAQAGVLPQGDRRKYN
jgi:hypothetical protein